MLTFLKQKLMPYRHFWFLILFGVIIFERHFSSFRLWLCVVVPLLLLDITLRWLKVIEERRSFRQTPLLQQRGNLKKWLLLSAVVGAFGFWLLRIVWAEREKQEILLLSYFLFILVVRWIDDALLLRQVNRELRAQSTALPS